MLDHYTPNWDEPLNRMDQLRAIDMVAALAQSPAVKPPAGLAVAGWPGRPGTRLWADAGG